MYQNQQGCIETYILTNKFLYKIVSGVVMRFVDLRPNSASVVAVGYRMIVKILKDRSQG